MKSPKLNSMLSKVLLFFTILLLLSSSHYGQAGSLDPSFGGDGIVTLNFPRSDVNQAFAVAVRPDNRVIVAGYAKSVAYNGDSSFAVARYLSTGVLDTSFNTQGFVRTWAFGSSYARAVAVQPDEKIVAAGETIINGATNFAVVRYTAAGALDPTFSADGIQTINFRGCYSCYATSVAVQNDGKILVAGEVRQTSTSSDFGLVRLNSDGSLDSSFNGSGRVITSFRGGSSANTILLQSDGENSDQKIIVGGNIGVGYGLVRYTATGSVDSSFGRDGTVVFAQNSEYGDSANAFALQPDGKIVGVAQSYYFSMYVFRLDANGIYDDNFGQALTGTRARPQAIAVTRNGNIVAVGQAYDSTPATAILIACFNSSGRLNPQFGNDGKLFTSFYSNPISVANGIAIQNNGKLIVAGYTGTTSPVNFSFAAARYLMNGL